MIKNIVFDIGNVLIDFDWGEYIGAKAMNRQERNWRISCNKIKSQFISLRSRVKS